MREVIAYKNRAEAENPRVPARYLSDEFRPLGLTEAEVDALTAFIEEGLFDPGLDRYTPAAVPSGQCFPNHDAVARAETGCL